MCNASKPTKEAQDLTVAIKVLIFMIIYFKDYVIIKVVIFGEVRNFLKNRKKKEMKYMRIIINLYVWCSSNPSITGNYVSFLHNTLRTLKPYKVHIMSTYMGKTNSLIMRYKTNKNHVKNSCQA